MNLKTVPLIIALFLQTPITHAKSDVSEFLSEHSVAVKGSEVPELQRGLRGKWNANIGPRRYHMFILDDSYMQFPEALIPKGGRFADNERASTSDVFSKWLLTDAIRIPATTETIAEIHNVVDKLKASLDKNTENAQSGSRKSNSELLYLVMTLEKEIKQAELLKAALDLAKSKQHKSVVIGKIKFQFDRKIYKGGINPTYVQDYLKPISTGTDFILAGDTLSITVKKNKVKFLRAPFDIEGYSKRKSMTYQREYERLNLRCGTLRRNLDVFSKADIADCKRYRDELLDLGAEKMPEHVFPDEKKAQSFTQEDYAFFRTPVDLSLKEDKLPEANFCVHYSKPERNVEAFDKLKKRGFSEILLDVTLNHIHRVKPANWTNDQFSEYKNIKPAISSIYLRQDGVIGISNEFSTSWEDIKGVVFDPENQWEYSDEKIQLSFANGAVTHVIPATQHFFFPYSPGGLGLPKSSDKVIFSFMVNRGAPICRD